MFQVNMQQEECPAIDVIRITKYHVCYKLKTPFVKESESYLNFLIKHLYFHTMIKVYCVSYSYFFPALIPLGMSYHVHEFL